MKAEDVSYKSLERIFLKICLLDLQNTQNVQKHQLGKAVRWVFISSPRSNGLVEKS